MRARLSPTCRVHLEHSEQCQARSGDYSPSFSNNSRPYGSCGSCCDTFGPSAHETVSVVAQSQGISSKGQSPEANQDYGSGEAVSSIGTTIASN